MAASILLILYCRNLRASVLQVLADISSISSSTLEAAALKQLVLVMLSDCCV
jgi:hypothetical protein